METTDIIKLLEIVILVIIAPFIPIIANKVKIWLDAKTSAEQRAGLLETVRLAVLATEQSGLNGVEARQHAIKLAQDALAAQGVVVDGNRLALVIEATVMDEFNKFKSTVVTTEAVDG